MVRGHKTAFVMALSSAFLFGAATPLSKWLLAGLSPFQLAGLLYLGAAAAMAPAALKGGGFGLPARSDRTNRLRLLGAVVFGGLLGPVLLLFGLQLAQAASVSLWLNLELAATAVLGVFLFRDHLGLRGWSGVIITLAGTSLLMWEPHTAGIIPGILVLLACLCWGLDNHLTALIDGITPAQSTFWKGITAGTINLMIGVSLSSISGEYPTLVIALLVGALSYGASIVLYINSAQSIGAIRAQVLFASAPFFGVALSVAMLGEIFSLLHSVAALFFIAGIILMMIESHSHWHAHEAMFHEHSHRHDDGHHNHEHSGMTATLRHSHPHRHEPLYHKHPHWPDIHHRHEHGSGDE